MLIWNVLSDIIASTLEIVSSSPTRSIDLYVALMLLLSQSLFLHSFVPTTRFFHTKMKGEKRLKEGKVDLCWYKLIHYAIGVITVTWINSTLPPCCYFRALLLVPFFSHPTHTLRLFVMEHPSHCASHKFIFLFCTHRWHQVSDMIEDGMRWMIRIG